jgi:hypothetical protein
MVGSPSRRLHHCSRRADNPCWSLNCFALSPLSRHAVEHLDEPLTPDLPVWGVVDVDARFQVGRDKSRVFRVVGIPVARAKDGEPGYIWLATNLPDRVAAETVGALAASLPSTASSRSCSRTSARCGFDQGAADQRGYARSGLYLMRCG